MKPNTNTLINPNLPTIPGTAIMPGISALVRILAKQNGLLSTPLRYGNRAQAEAKIRALLPRLTEGDNTATVVPVDGRFLVAIFPAEYDLDIASGKLIAKSRCTATVPSGNRCGRPAIVRTGLCSIHTSGKRKGATVEVARSRPPFATVSGPRINPRNQHNHPHTLAANGLQPVYCEQQTTRAIPRKTQARIAIRPINRLGQYRTVSERVNQEPKRRHW